jgi:ribosomal protein L33
MTEDMNRCKRAEWVLNQYEIFFDPRLGGHPRSVKFTGNELDSAWEIVAIKDNFVIAEKTGIVDDRCKIFVSPSQYMYVIVIQSRSAHRARQNSTSFGGDPFSESRRYSSNWSPQSGRCRLSLDNFCMVCRHYLLTDVFWIRVTN